MAGERSDAERQVADLLRTARSALGLDLASLIRMDGTPRYLQVGGIGAAVHLQRRHLPTAADHLLPGGPQRQTAGGDAQRQHTALVRGQMPIRAAVLVNAHNRPTGLPAGEPPQPTDQLVHP